jgi:outer membrane protein OmpA-like peptidoglycan-associated protein
MNNFSLKKALSFALVFLFFAIAKAQVNDSSMYKKEFFQTIDPLDFQSERFAEVMLVEVNKYRNSQGVDTLEFLQCLQHAAEDQAVYNAAFQRTDILQPTGKKKDTGTRVTYFGGSKNATELVDRVNIKTGTDFLTYQKAAEDIVFRIKSQPKRESVLLKADAVFIGVGGSVDIDGKRLYFSLVFGDYSSLNEGATRKSEMEIPFSPKRYGLFAYDDKACKKCEAFKGLQDLQKGLYTKDGKVYFKTSNYRDLSKLMRNSKDGIGVDFVQREQYPCIGDNILDQNLVNKGVMVKPVWSSKFEKKNLVQGVKERKKMLDICIGKIPKAFIDLDPSEYNMNLIFIQDKYVCKNLSPAYVEIAGLEYNNQLQLLADTVTPPHETPYSPSATGSNLSFKIPFEKGKSNYKPEDLLPFIKALREPDFKIDELNISAYSSIEGTDEINSGLQKRRAESIQNALKARQKDNIISKISTDQNWEEFKRDVAGTEFSNLANGSSEDAQKAIREQKLDKKLEPILKNHRYARIDMKVTYEIDGDKEEAYVVKMFNDAVKSYNYDQALKIQKYLFKKVVSGVYTKDAVFNMEIPEHQSTAGLLMNKLWLEQFVNKGDFDEDCCNRVENLNQLDGQNQYILFNNLLCNFIYTKLKEEEIPIVQAAINTLYDKGLDKGTIDLLNLEFQFTIIDALDTTETEHPLVTESLNRVKEIVNMEESNWQNSLKLAYIFMANGDYNFAARLLTPFIKEKYVFEEVLFTYIALCTNLPERLYTASFVNAVDRALKMNPDRFCKLVKDGKLTFQVFENTKVKEKYCNQCKN